MIEFKTTNECGACGYALSSRGTCKQCYQRAYKQRNPDKFRAYARRRYAERPEDVRAYRTSFKGRYIQARYKAEKRGLPFLITLEQYTSLLSLNCAYCASDFSGEGLGVGLDQVKPGAGYTIDNVVPCCRRCNKLKMDHLTADEMNRVTVLLRELRGGSVWA